MNCSFCRSKCWCNLKALNIYLRENDDNKTIRVFLWENGCKDSCEIWTNCRYLGDEHFQLIHLMGNFKACQRRGVRQKKINQKLDEFLKYVMDHIDFKKTSNWLKQMCPYATEVMMDMFINEEIKETD